MSIELNCGRFARKPTDEYYLRQFVHWLNEYADTVELRIGLDACIFDDGELIGADESDLAKHYTAYVQAKQDLYRSLMDGLNSGRSIDEVLHTIEAVSAAAAERPGFDFGSPLAVYPRQT